MFLSKLLGLSRVSKKRLFMGLDVLAIGFAFWLAFGFRLGISAVWHVMENWLLLAALIVMSLFICNSLGLYRTVIRYAGLKMIQVIGIASVLSVLSLMVAAFFSHTFLPRTIPIVYFMLLTAFLLGSRFTIKGVLQGWQRARNRPVLIYGAGASGQKLFSITMKTGNMLPIAFIDDDARLHDQQVCNRRVYPSDRLAYLLARYGVESILLAMPNASQQQRQVIIRRLTRLPCKILSIPSIEVLNLLGEAAGMRLLKKVSITDLLGRDVIEPDKALMAENILGKSVMVTGAGGSIGSELCRQIIQHKPSTLVLFELSEFSLHRIERELRNYLDRRDLGTQLVPILGSVQHRRRTAEIMQHFSVQTLYHAAAYKHVPLVEYNTIEGLRNNLFGTLYAAKASIDAGVATFVLISTDKAVRPSNTMGATKRMAELVLQALAQQTPTKTTFCIVRFGNVLGSSGSVIPLFEQQIAEGGPVTVTHPEMTRYFMTIPEASQLVIQAGAMSKGGDVFVLDMGEPIKIIELAEQMIRLSGLSVRCEQCPDGDIEIVTTGLRPGEKLYEELLIGEQAAGTSHPRIMTSQESHLPWCQLRSVLDELEAACKNFDAERVRELLIEAPTGFEPTSAICDMLANGKHYSRPLV